MCKDYLEILLYVEFKPNVSYGEFYDDEHSGLEYKCNDIPGGTCQDEAG